MDQQPSFTYLDNGINAVVIDNFYTPSQLDEIMKELTWLTKPSIFLTQENLGASTSNETGEYQAAKSGVWLENVFVNWRHSALMKYCFENFQDDNVKNKLLSLNPLFKILYSCNRRGHLLSYYEDGGFYRPHIDNCVFTILNYFNVEPKKFWGGNLNLYSFDENIKRPVDVKNNRVVLITGNTKHEATEIMTKKDIATGEGRYCSAVFLNIISDEDLKRINNNGN